MTPGFRRIKPERPLGEPWRKMVGIIIAEHAVSESESSWYSGPTYDVLTVEDQNIIYDVKACALASGSNDVMFQRYQVSNPAVARKVYGAVSGNESMPKMEDLDGARVLVEFLHNKEQATEPYISNCFAYDEMPRNKIPNAKAAAPQSTDILSGYIDDLAKQIDDNSSLKDYLTSNNQAGVIYKARQKYIAGMNGDLKYPEPPTADTEEKRALWQSAFETAWSMAFQNTYWSSGFDASNTGSVDTEFENSWIAEDATDESTTNILKDGWRKGWKQGDTDANTELLISVPEPPAANNSGATVVSDDDASEPADTDATEWKQTAAKGKTAVWYLEKRGCRLVVGADGSFTLDTRTSNAPIRLQGGDNGITLTANGTIIEIGTDSDSIVKITSDVAQVISPDIQLGPKDKVTEHVPTWEESKPIHAKHNEILTSLNTLMSGLKITLNGIASGSGDQLFNGAGYVTDDVSADLIEQDANISNDKPMSEIVSVARKVEVI